MVILPGPPRKTQRRASPDGGEPAPPSDRGGWTAARRSGQRRSATHPGARRGDRARCSLRAQGCVNHLASAFRGAGPSPALGSRMVTSSAILRTGVGWGRGTNSRKPSPATMGSMEPKGDIVAADDQPCRRSSLLLRSLPRREATEGWRASNRIEPASRRRCRRPRQARETEQ